MSTSQSEPGDRVGAGSGSGEHRTVIDLRGRRAASLRAGTVDGTQYIARDRPHALRLWARVARKDRSSV
jgi:hypothetical protein